MKDLHQFPDDEVIAPVIDVYIRESERIYGPKWCQLAGNSADQMLKELKRFVLVNALFTIFTSLRCDEKLQQTLPLDPKLIMTRTDREIPNKAAGNRIALTANKVSDSVTTQRINLVPLIATSIAR
ncbi:unnamed protein product [Medioppia subpectinata]|uniref:Uncharacterized protein n=1 Tax=Medioppia subpectinata TaxID=1979941 RepID=A0A7R9Q1S6_9ACAR|nr:unnamed protein product [Medioppia subpectinata]CAG2109385.1 unnamed protein product [Medioppia subpectinata]